MLRSKEEVERPCEEGLHIPSGVGTWYKEAQKRFEACSAGALEHQNRRGERRKPEPSSAVCAGGCSEGRKTQVFGRAEQECMS